MSLRDKLRNPVQTTRCKTSAIYDVLSDEDEFQLREALKDPDVQSTTIAIALREEGYFISEASVRRHRKGVCSCGSV